MPLSETVRRLRPHDQTRNFALRETDPAKLAQYIWSGMANDRKKLERGSYIATGHRVIDNVVDRTHTESEVELFGAFDHKKSQYRFDRSERVTGFNDVPARPFPIAKLEAGKLIMTSRKSIYWTETRAPLGVVVIAEPPFRPGLQGVSPLDVRSLGLQFWNRDSSLFEFEEVLKTWTDGRLETIVQESEHFFRVTASSGRNNSIDQTVWVDQSRGFTASRCEIASNGRPPMYVSELIWVQIHGTWVPKKYVNARHQGSLSDTYDLSFKWTSVNKPIDESLFTVAGLGLSKDTPIIERPQGD